MEKITIIGTSHIARDSVEKVRKTISEEKPDIVAVELDHARLHAILHGKGARPGLAALKAMGATGLAFYIIGGFVQRKLGRLIGTEPGEEMKTALELARKNSIRVALVDQPINVTMQNLSRIGLREKLGLARDALLGALGIGEKIRIDLSKTPDGQFIKEAMEKVKGMYPQLYKALVQDRNEYMAGMLAKIRRMEPESKIVAVVGAGHEKELARLLREKISGKG